MSTYFEDEIFEQQDFIKTGDYEGCSFKNCELSKANLSNTNFIDCRFENCNLSGAVIIKTSFQETIFSNCKMLGLHFDDANTFLFTPKFQGCALTLCSFYGVTLKNASFTNCIFHEADFTDANCSGIVFNGCDFLHAKFENTNLEKADLRTAFNYSIDPELNKIKKAAFSFPAVSGLLDKYDIRID
ncbi:MAG: pentapeptide repeat-containing protein [Niabella sp.]|nr:pentapeptide repeat-containing protein [Niabella sp.]